MNPEQVEAAPRVHNGRSDVTGFIRSGGRRMILWAAVVGAMLGAGGGLAQAWSGQWSHNFALWNHGHDGDHVYMSSLDGAGREAFVAYLYENVCSPGSFHS